MPERTFPPGPDGPLTALRGLQQDRLQFMVDMTRYGDMAHYRAGPVHVFQINHPDLIHEVLVKHAYRFEKSPLFKDNANRIIGEGLLTSEGDKHKRQRRLVQPAFHHQRLISYADAMARRTQTMLEERWSPGATLDIDHEMMQLTLEIVTETLFGAEVASHSIEDIGQAITDAMEYVMQRMTALFRLPDWIPTPLHRAHARAAELLDDVILGLIAQRRASGEDTGDLLSMLLLAEDETDGSGMDDQQVRDEAMTIFLAGHETTANALAWTFYLLAQHPAVEAKLLDEIDTALAGRAPTFDDLKALPYTELVIKEALRLYPPAWSTGRYVVEAIELGGYQLEPGDIVFISPYTMHHDGRYFEQPDAFMPERFADDLEKRLPRYAYFPFGGGPRICIGNSFAMMEAQLVLATILGRYTLALVPGQQVEPEPLVTLRPKGGVQMIAQARATEPAAQLT